MRFKLLPFLPWKPTAVFTGVAVYEVDTQSGLITSHTDLWDAVSNNDYLSLEALRYVLESLAQVGVAGVVERVWAPRACARSPAGSQVQVTPDLETPDYVILFKTSTYEIRRYQKYTVAEVPMQPGSGPAGGGGFGELAGTRTACPQAV